MNWNGIVKVVMQIYFVFLAYSCAFFGIVRSDSCVRGKSMQQKREWLKRGPLFFAFPKGPPQISLSKLKFASELLSAPHSLIGLFNWKRFIHLALKGRHILARGVEA